MATISVAMATCNGARHLAEQLDSLARQTRLPDELVVCDDASADATVAKVEAFAAGAPFPVRLLRNPRRLGCNANFARVIAACAGELILIADQDDRWLPTKVARMAAALAARPAALVATCDQEIVDADGRALGGTVLGNVRALGYPDGAFGPGCCTALRRELLALAVPFPGGRVPYDHWLTTLADRLGARLLIAEPLQTYRRHGSNASAAVFAAAQPGWRAALAEARRGDPRQRLAAAAAGLEAVAARLAGQRALIVSTGHGDRLPAALDGLARDVGDLHCRLAALGLGRWRRVAAIGRLWRCGVYGRARGVRTALKDLAS